MKIRLAKKIMKPNFRNGKIGYWHSRYDLYCMGFDGCKDHRITKAISLVEYWNARRYRNEAAKFNKINDIKPTVDVIDVIKPIYNFKAKL